MQPAPSDVFVPDVALEARVFTCDPLRIEPSAARVATDRAVTLRVLGGSGIAPVRIEGETLGAYVEPGGRISRRLAARDGDGRRDGLELQPHGAGHC